MGRFIIVVLDGFGMGEMEDVRWIRPADIGAHTFAHILEAYPNLYLPNLEKLGLMNIYGKSSNKMKPQEKVTCSKAKLMHHGADTFFGHQEIMGTYPEKPFGEPFRNKINEVEKVLQEHGYLVERIKVVQESYLLINGVVTIGDNIECDLGQAFNVTVPIDYIEFEEAVIIAKLVRSVSVVPRVIVFGGSHVTKEDILNAKEEHGEYVGINAPKSGVYDENYHCIHLGYGVDPTVQIQTILGEAGIPVYLLGKAADVIQNQYGTSLSIVPTEEVLETALELVKSQSTLFICANVQETDLSGHLENSERYKKILEIADKGIGKLMDAISEDDILIVMADHGNDPNIGHPHHTREHVPLMIQCNKMGGLLESRNTLSDIAATAAEYFNVNAPQNGTPMREILIN